MDFFSKIISQKPGYSWLLLVSIILIIYSGTISHNILYNFDDDAYLNDTRITQLSPNHVKTYFSDYFLGMYQPIPVLSFALVEKLFPSSIPAQRWANILLHCINALLVLLLVRRLSSNAWLAWLSALIFAIHPMHVESVTWLSTRSNLIYSLFYLLSLWYFVKSGTQSFVKNISLMFMFFILALLSKVTAATFPMLIILIAWYTNRKITLKTVLLFLLLIVFSFAFVWIGVKASGSFGHIAELGLGFSLIDRAFILLNALWLYIVKAFLPVKLSAIYLYPILESGHLPDSYYLLGVLTIIILLSTIFYGIQRLKKYNDKTILFGLFFFLITISIVLPLKWSRTVLIAERYTYIPYIGITLLVLLIVFRSTKNSPLMLKNSLIAGLLGYMLFFSVQSYQRNKIWESPFTLFTDVIKKNRTAAEVSMGYFNRGNEYLRLEQKENAYNDYSSAIKVNPSYAEAYFNRGLVYYNQSLFLEAIADFSQTIKYQPNHLDAFVNRGVAFRATGDYEKSLSDFNYVLKIKPDGKAYFNRGVLFCLNLGDTSKACSDWNKALENGIPQAEELINMYCK